MPLFLVAMGLGWALLLPLPAVQFPAHLAAWAVAVAGWLLGFVRPPPWAATVGVGLGARLLALAAAPGFSLDAARYVYEGRVVRWGGLMFPYAHSPADGPALGVPPALLDSTWAAINHPELPTIYPPLAQLVFAGASAAGDLLGDPLLALRATLVAADLATWRLLHAKDPRAGWAWGLCPLVVIEVARDGHGDGLAALGLAAALLSFSRGRSWCAHLGLAAAALTKLNGLVLAPLAARIAPRSAWPWAVAAPVALLPLAVAGSDSGLAAYAARWRAGDGAFALLVAAAETGLGGPWRWIPELGLTVSSGALARGLAAALFLLAYACLVRRARTEDFGDRAALLLLLLLLLAPTFHPWYALWLLPFAALGHAQAPILWLLATAPLLHHPAWLEATQGQWRELVLPRVAVHGPAWVLLVGSFRRSRQKDGPSDGRASPGGASSA